MLPTDYHERKRLPVFTYLTKYFPDAFLEVVRVAVAGNAQHLNETDPGEIRWAREKSTDQLNTALRHIMDYGMGVKTDEDGRAHLAKAIWRLSAQLQLDIEAERTDTHVVDQTGYCVVPGCNFQQIPVHDEPWAGAPEWPDGRCG